MNYGRLSPSFKHVMLAIENVKRPNSYGEACKYSHWRKALDDEISALKIKNLDP